MNDVSLRRSLTRRLFIALALIGALGTLIAYLLGSRIAIFAYDQTQFSDVLALAGQVSTQDGHLRVNLPPIARKILLADPTDQVIYRVIDLSDGAIVDANGSLGQWENDPKFNDEPYFRNVQVDGKFFRVAYMRHIASPDGLPALIEIGQTTLERTRMIWSIFIGTALLMVVIVLTAVAVVWDGVNRVLLPLNSLESEAALRSSTNLRPLDPSAVPREVRGFILSINRMMRRLDDSIASQRRFIANAAHQLRTPVAGVRLQAEIALKNFPANSVRENIQEIVDSATRAGHIIDQLLVLSRAEAEELKSGNQSIDLTELSCKVIERHLQQAIRKHVDLGYKGIPDSAIVTGNEILLAELLSNLVDNAIIYGHEGGQVTVATDVLEDRVVLSVSDDGPGIADFDQEQLFERFDRPDSSSAGGAGLGLAIVREIAQKFHAEIDVQTKVGHGSRFSITFQRAHVPETQADPDLATASGEIAG